VLFRQLFDKTSCTYTYLIADLESHEALFIDPVASNIDDYLTLYYDEVFLSFPWFRYI
jgi:hypothetical protein